MDSGKRTKLAGKTFLVVDDEEDLREIIRFELENQGAHVLEAPNGNVAFEILTHNPQIDGVISDLKMPECSGVELAERIHALPKPTPVVIVSAFLHSADIRRSPGVSGLVSKPFEFSELLDTIERSIS